MWRLPGRVAGRGYLDSCERHRRRWHEDRHKTAKSMAQVITGWFIDHSKRLLMRALRRRSQKDRTAWETINSLVRKGVAHRHHPAVLDRR